MEIILAFVGLISFIGLIISIVMLFKKSWRKKGVIVLIVSLLLLIVCIVISPSLDESAKEKGFANAEEMMTAKKYNITDITEWNDKKEAILEQERIKKEEADQKERAINAFYAIPADQQAFVEAVIDAKDAYYKAENDLQKGGIRRERAKAVCQAVSSPAVSNWVGTIDELTTNSDGHGVLSIKLADGLVVKTWNNAISDVMDKTLIDPDTKIFQTLATLKKGAKVKFSGSFLRDRQKTDCYEEQSLSLSGSMTDPEYLFRFNSISVFEE